MARGQHAPAPRHAPSRRWCCSPRSTSSCTGCRGCRTRCASGRPARSTGSRRSASAARSTRSRTSWSTSGCGSASTASELIVVHVDGPDGPREVARHRLTTPGRPSIHDEHYPPRPAGALERKPAGPQREERAFLAIGDGRRAVADRRPPRRARRGCGARWPRRSTSPSSTAPSEVERALATCAQRGPVRRRRPRRDPRPPAGSGRA